MKEIFQEYGGILITVVAILSIILFVTAVIGSDATGIVGKTSDYKLFKSCKKECQIRGGTWSLEKNILDRFGAL